MPISHFRRTVGAAAVAAGSLVFLAAPVEAQTCYPPTPGCVTTTSSLATAGPTLDLSDTSVTRGQQVTATIRGFRAGSSGILTFLSVETQVGTFTMPAAGPATATITIPTSATLGAHTVFAKGTAPNGGAAVASKGATVVAGGTGTGGTRTGGTLARTGAVVVPTAVVGAGLVLGGMALKRSGRRGKASKAA